MSENLKELILIDNNIFIKFSDDNLIPFPSIEVDYIALERSVRSRLNAHILAHKQNPDLEEFVNIYRIEIIKQLRNKL